MVSCATAGLGWVTAWTDWAVPVWGVYGHAWQLQRRLLTTDQGTSAGCSLFRVAAGDERWRGRQLDQLEHRGGGFVPSFLSVLGDLGLDHGNQGTVGTAFIKSL